MTLQQGERRAACTPGAPLVPGHRSTERDGLPTHRPNRLCGVRTSRWYKETLLPSPSTRQGSLSLSVASWAVSLGIIKKNKQQPKQKSLRQLRPGAGPAAGLSHETSTYLRNTQCENVPVLRPPKIRTRKQKHQGWEFQGRGTFCFNTVLITSSPYG